MGNCGTREESAVAPHAQVQQLHLSSLSSRTEMSERKHNRSVLAPSDLSTPRILEDSRKNVGLYTHVIAFTLYELETITKSFRSDYILGAGGFGTVYKGYIDENVRVGLKSLPVAVKVLNKEGRQGHREWLTEMTTGYSCMSSCFEGASKITYFESGKPGKEVWFDEVPGGDYPRVLFALNNWPEAAVPLSWSARMMIALGAAKGLAFLHNAERPVIYRDFKTSNILLDSDYTAKLSDFGLAKAGPQGDETHVSTRVMGTYGYAAPEYVMTGHLTARSDVYSFGVVLLELLTGRRSVDKTRPSKEQNLVDWARPKLNDKRKFLQILDPRLENQYSIRAAQKACSLAYYCVSRNPKARPLMRDVVDTLEPLQGARSDPASRMSASSSTFASARGDASSAIKNGKVANNAAATAAAPCQSPNASCSPGGFPACGIR
ncbi:hypothetical protein Nepgr_011913 [Nepenthes gracilis]|uniref:Protein kinase domain-containing protein n=1 Tax=Nepenthes gracilis TaxID=150966 RepID=A0AAD3SF61_NEPGR|nr:hypothetical protein Nepgr_011913 [Nepenthes gracilis]